MEYAAYQLGVQHVIIDNLQFMLSSTLNPTYEHTHCSTDGYEKRGGFGVGKLSSTLHLDMHDTNGCGS